MSVLASVLLAVTIVAHDPGYTTSLANHLKRWLGAEGVAANVVTPSAMKAALKNERLAFLVGFSSPSKSEIETLRSFRSRGGKMVVFHSASPALADMMGVKPVGYASAPYPGSWSRMDFSTTFPEGMPRTIRQSSAVLQRARPVKGKARVIATWADRSGKSTGEPAWIASSSGYWMTHVLQADGDEDMKARLLGAIVGSINPKAWNYASHKARVDASAAVMRQLALKQVPLRGEIHAVWDQSGCGLYPGNWPLTIKVLRESRVTDLFVNFAGAAFAHYSSSVLPRSKTFEQEGDQIAACLAAAKASGIRVHAWMICFSATRGTAERMDIFQRKGWRLKATNGKYTEYLDPSLADVRSYVLSAVDEMQSRYPQLNGIHLDFVRWGDSAIKPKNAASYVSAFVSDARRRVKRPRWLTTAVYGKYPQCVASVGQDWYGWLNSGIVDYVVPMDYTQSMSVLDSLFRQHASPKSHARRTIVGLGVTANESRLNAADVIAQIGLSRRYGFAGVALFDLDVTLEKSILPYLRLGMW